VEADARAIALTAAWNHYLDISRTPRQQPEVRGGRAMGEHRALTAREHRREETCPRWLGHVTHGEDTAMDAMQSPVTDPVGDLGVGEANIAQLLSRDPTALG
jgi:hypothetical protein